MQNSKTIVIVASILILTVMAVGYSYVVDTLSGATSEEQWVRCANTEPDVTVAEALGFHYVVDFLVATPKRLVAATAVLTATAYMLLRASPLRRTKGAGKGKGSSQ